MELEYFNVMRAEQKPDVYGGKNCDEHLPRWEAFAEGDMDSDFLEEISLDPKQFPAGTKVVVMEPVCPECNCNASVCQAVGECKFDWREWAELRYS